MRKNVQPMTSMVMQRLNKAVWAAVVYGGFGGGGADFSDIFGDVFGDIFGGGRRQRASRGADLRYNMD